VTVLSRGTSDAKINAIVSVPFTFRITCANCANSFANACSQIGFRSGHWSKCRYSSFCPVATSVIECADSIVDKAVAMSWYTLSSCVNCGGMWGRGLRRGLYGAALVTSGWLVVLVNLVS
jgi:hypothetical protein